MVKLRGLTWDQPRGYNPLHATANSYMALHPDVSIEWFKRDSVEWATVPFDKLAQSFDLFIVDHPFIGWAANNNLLVPLDHYLEANQLLDLLNNSVGQSHVSYSYQQHQWALAVDAAAQVTAYRPDLIEHYELELPGSWEEILEFAAKLKAGKQHPLMGIPLLGLNALVTFFTLCGNAGEIPFSTPERVVSRTVGQYALATLGALTNLSHPMSLQWHPPALLEHMTNTDELIYCPLIYGYTEYARPNWKPKLINFIDMPYSTHNNKPCGSTLGGTGLAVSNFTAPAAKPIACDYAAYVASEQIQSTIYFQAGGQPGHRQAWLNPQLNNECSNFFVNTLQTVEEAFLRPHYDGFVDLQQEGSKILVNFLSHSAEFSIERTLDDLDTLYRNSLKTLKRV